MENDEETRVTSSRKKTSPPIRRTRTGKLFLADPRN